MRVLIAALLGAIAMFVWTSIAHMATPLASMGLSQIPNEQAVMSSMKDNILAPGLYFYPWMDPKDPNAMSKMQQAEKVSPHGILIYSPPGVNADTDMGPMLIREFLKQFVQALIAAWIASLVAGGFDMRFAVVTGMFISSGIAVNISYWNWYHFPLSFTLAAVTMEVVSGIVAGVAIAWWLGRRTA
jgi:hypothetical protein